ncbi:MAG: DUF4253 domain-containing protein [Bacteroidetes bacterium]|nr:DUF4253 domain-containing protein [Bacteroidota bacterium]
MKKKQIICGSLVWMLVTLISCRQQAPVQAYVLNAEERHWCDSMQLDSSVIQDLRKLCSGTMEPFHYSLSKMIQHGVETEVDPMHLNGLVIQESNTKSYNLVLSLRENFRKRGYSIFLLENGFGINGRADHIGILKTTDKYTILKEIKTDGINYDIDTDSLCRIIKQFDDRYSLELIGASGDWCEFLIKSEPTNWTAFAQEVYKVCPDVVDQGTGSVEALADEMKRSHRLFFWWD